MEVSQATAGLLPTKVKDWLLRMRYAFVGANLPQVDKQIETLQDAANSLAESVEELEEFKFTSEKWKSEVMNKAYEVVDKAAHRNSTDWISDAMKRVLMRSDFLSEEKQDLIERCLGDPHREFVNITTALDDHIVQKQVRDIEQIKMLKDDLAEMMVRKILHDLPSLIEVTQKVSQDYGRGETFCELKLKPNVWILRNPTQDRIFGLPRR